MVGILVSVILHPDVIILSTCKWILYHSHYFLLTLNEEPLHKFTLILSVLRELFRGPKALKYGLTEKACEDFHMEYSDLKMNVEVVQSLEEAIDHIHQYGRWVDLTSLLTPLASRVICAS